MMKRVETASFSILSGRFARMLMMRHGCVSWACICRHKIFAHCADACICHLAAIVVFCIFQLWA